MKILSSEISYLHIVQLQQVPYQFKWVSTLRKTSEQCVYNWNTWRI